jgi:hypothetical protein
VHYRFGDATGATTAGCAAQLPALHHFELIDTGIAVGASAPAIAVQLPRLATLDVRKGSIASETNLGLAPCVRA